MSYGIKMAREPQMDTSAPEVEDYEEGDAIRALGFLQAIKAGRDVTYRNRGCTNDWPISAFLSDRSKDAQQALFKACGIAYTDDSPTGRALLRFMGLCAEEFGQETE